METAKVKTVESRRTKTGRDIFIVKLEDGREYTSWDKKFAGLSGAMVGFTLKEKGGFTNIEFEKLITMAQDAPEQKTADAVKGTNDTPFVCACTLLSGLISGMTGNGASAEEIQGEVGKQFSAYYEFATKMYDTHKELSEYREAAEALME